MKLTEVELCEGLVEIGDESFGYCNHSIWKINIPDTLKRIKGFAFWRSLRCPIRLHDGIESIGIHAFSSCIFTNFRVPPLITAIPYNLLRGCRSMFSLELSVEVTEIGNEALAYCYCLRNVAFPPDANVGIDIFGGGSATEQYDLYQLFGSIAELKRALSHRFDGLLIHSIVYDQSYNQEVLQKLISASKLDATGNQQDCLGMTPLHILACSSIHDLEVYRIIVEKYPANLITEDRWGALPLLYAFWGAAPAEIIQFLLESYQSLYPGHVFNWAMMVKTMGRCDTPKKNIENLLCVKQMHFPEQPIDWEYLLDEFLSSSHHSFGGRPFQEKMQFLFMCGMSSRVEALAFKIWRDCITNMIHTANFEYNGDNCSTLRWIRTRIAHFEDEFLRLKEATSILELALWKMRMHEKRHQDSAAQSQKKIKTDKLSMRRQCRITCGADVVIRHVLPYLITAAYKRSASYAESSSDEESSDSIDASAESDSNSSSDEASSDSM
jgi:hypothetical protein